MRHLDGTTVFQLTPRKGERERTRKIQIRNGDYPGRFRLLSRRRSTNLLLGYEDKETIREEKMIAENPAVYKHRATSIRSAFIQRCVRCIPLSASSRFRKIVMDTQRVRDHDIKSRLKGSSRMSPIAFENAAESTKLAIIGPTDHPSLTFSRKYV